MSRVILYAVVVALVVYSASCVPAGKDASCPPGSVWTVADNECIGRCPKSIPKIKNPCGTKNPSKRCVCKTGYFMDNGLCVFEQACSD